MENIDKNYLHDPSVYAVILGGGKSSRLYSLTARRAKPAVPMYGKYRMIDFVLSNCRTSNIDYINILTQYEPDSLERHIKSGIPWNYDESHLSIRSPGDRRTGFSVYNGTESAVRGIDGIIKKRDPDAVLILSGDHIYSENYRLSIRDHLEKNRDVTLYTKAVPLKYASDLGVLKINDNGRIIDFKEKPKDIATQNEYKLSEKAKRNFGITQDGDFCLASMGIYIFSPDVLHEELSYDENENDFGKEMIPRILGKRDVYAHMFEKYWEDVGILDKLVEANFHALTNPEDIFNSHLITNMRNIKPATIRGTVENSIISDGCYIEKGARVKNSILGYQTIVEAGANIENSIIFGGERHHTDGRGNIKQEIYSYVRSGATLCDVLLDRNIDISKGVSLIGKQKEEYMRNNLLSIDLQENNEENPYGSFNVTPNGILIFGKPEHGTEILFPENFKI